MSVWEISPRVFIAQFLCNKCWAWPMISFQIFTLAHCVLHTSINLPVAVEATGDRGQGGIRIESLLTTLCWFHFHGSLCRNWDGCLKTLMQPTDGDNRHYFDTKRRTPGSFITWLTTTSRIITSCNYLPPWDLKWFNQCATSARFEPIN